MTLIEMVVGLGVGILVLLGMVLIFMTSNRSFVAMGNYLIMDQASRNALSQMTRDIRKSRNLVSYSTNQLVLDYDGATQLTYRWDPAKLVLTQSKTGSPTAVLLTNCVYLQFVMYNNLPQAGFVFGTTTDVTKAKSISVHWKCSQSILGRTTTSEDMQQALIVIRNKPVS